jgi:predicted membrane channel-forming protein YqfA (hemolysin III family)
LAIVGESHFAATLFFFSKKNRDYILRNRLWFIYIPIILVILNTVLFLWNVVVTLVIASLMSAYHVTRQSIGINRLYSRRNKKLEYMIYLSSAWFVFYGGLKLFQNLNLVRFLPKLVESNYLNIMDG